MKDVVLVAHNVRSMHNVGSLLRTADGLGVKKVFLSGYTPYPMSKTDTRLPHISQKTHRQISKTALGAEESIDTEHIEDIIKLINELREAGYQICALEQSPSSIPLPNFKPSKHTVLIVGNEVDGLEQEVLQQTDVIVEIPMRGKKESFNVVQAAAIALYSLTLQTP